MIAGILIGGTLGFMIALYREEWDIAVMIAVVLTLVASSLWK